MVFGVEMRSGSSPTVLHVGAVLLGPIKAVTYLLMYGCTGAGFGWAWAASWPWTASIAMVGPRTAHLSHKEPDPLASSATNLSHTIIIKSVCTAYSLVFKHMPDG